MGVVVISDIVVEMAVTVVLLQSLKVVSCSEVNSIAYLEIRDRLW